MRIPALQRFMSTAFFLGAFGLSACGGADRGRPTATMSPAAVTSETRQPSPTATVTVAPPPAPSLTMVAGISVRDLVVSDPVALTPETAYFIGTGCWGCEGYTTGLQRWVTDAQGVATKTELLTFPRRAGEGVTGVVASDDASIIVATTCLAARCGRLARYTAPASSRVWVSRDSGVTWIMAAEEEGVMQAIAASSEAVLLGRGHGVPDDAAGWVIDYFVLGGSALHQPANAAPYRDPILLPGTTVAWVSPDGDALLDSSGDLLVRFSLQPAGRIVQNGPFTPNAAKEHSLSRGMGAQPSTSAFSTTAASRSWSTRPRSTLS